MEARDQRDECRSLLEEGVDPSDHVYRATSRREDESRRTASRFYIDEEGALSIRMGRRRLILTPKDTADLRIFLDATRSLTGGQGPCR